MKTRAPSVPRVPIYRTDQLPDLFLDLALNAPWRPATRWNGRPMLPHALFAQAAALETCLVDRSWGVSRKR